MSTIKNLTIRMNRWVIALRLRWLITSIEGRMKDLKGLIPTTAKAVE